MDLMPQIQLLTLKQDILMDGYTIYVRQSQHNNKNAKTLTRKLLCLRNCF